MPTENQTTPLTEKEMNRMRKIAEDAFDLPEDYWIPHQHRSVLDFLRNPKMLRFDNYRDMFGNVWRSGKVGWRRLKR